MQECLLYTANGAYRTLYNLLGKFVDSSPVLFRSLLPSFSAAILSRGLRKTDYTDFLAKHIRDGAPSDIRGIEALPAMLGRPEVVICSSDLVSTAFREKVLMVRVRYLCRDHTNLV